MAIRRLMMMGLANYIRYLIDSFINRTAVNNTLYEPDSCEFNNLTELNSKNLLDDVKLVMIPNAYQEGIVYSQLDNTDNSDFTFVRGSSSVTRTNPSGNVQGIPWNIITNSQNFSAWSLQNATLDSNFFTAPDGSNTARLLLDTTSTTDHRIQIGNSLPDNIYFTFSAYLKMQNIRYAQLSLLSGGITAFFDLQDGVELATQGVNTTSSMTPTGNGWWKCEVTGIKATGTTLPRIILSTNGTNITFTGTGTDGIYIWGTQITRTSDPYTPIYCKTGARTNFPRLDYSDSDCAVLPIEISKPNYFLYSSDFTNSVWAKTNVTASSFSELSPSLEDTSSLLTSNAANSSVKQQGAALGTVSISRIFSVYLKRKTGTGNIVLSVGRTAYTVPITSNWERYYVADSQLTGTYTSTSGNYTVTTTVAHGLSAGDVVRFDATSGTAVDAYITVLISTATQYTFTTGSLTTSGTCNTSAHFGKITLEDNGDEIYVWGAQLEAVPASTNYPLPTSYIPTTTTNVTRSAESCYIQNLQTNGIISPDFTIYMKIKRIGGSGSGSNPIFFISNNTTLATSTDLISVSGVGTSGLSTVGLGIYRNQNSGGVIALSTVLNYNPLENEYFTLILTMNSGRMRMLLNNTSVISSTFANPQLLQYLSFPGTSTVYINEISIWDRCLGISEINNLVSYPFYNAGISFVNQETQFIVNRAHSEGFTLPNTTILGYIDSLITEMKNDDIWDLSDSFFNFAYNDISLVDFSRINWKLPYSQLGLGNYVNNVTYRDIGIKGSSSTDVSYFETNYNPIRASVNYTLNLAGRFFICSEGGAGWYDGSGNQNQMRTTAQNLMINSTATLSPNINLTGTGLKGMMRDDSVNVRVIDVSTVINATSTTTSFADNTFRLLNNYFATGSGNMTCSAYYIGSSLTTTQTQNFRNYYNTFLLNLGLPQIA